MIKPITEQFPAFCMTGAAVWDRGIIPGKQRFTCLIEVCMEQRFLSATVFPTSAGVAPQTREIQLTLFPEHPGPVPAVSWWPVPAPRQGLYLAAPCNCHVRIWKIPSGTEVFTYKGHTRMVCTTMFAPQGQQWVASSGEDRESTDLGFHCTEQ